MASAVEQDKLGQDLRQYLRRVEGGETLEVLEEGNPVAVLAPLPQHPEAIKRLAAAGRVIPARLSLASLGEPLDGVDGIPASVFLAEQRADRVGGESALSLDEDPDPELWRAFDSQFSPQAQKAVFEETRRTKENLIRAALIRKARTGSPVVSRFDVVEAALAASPSQPTSGLSRLAGLVGGVLLGGAVSQLLALLLSHSEWSKATVILTFVAATVGAFLIALDINTSSTSRPVLVRRRSRYQARVVRGGDTPAEEAAEVALPTKRSA